MPKSWFHLAFAIGCIFIFAALQFLLWKFNLFVFHHLRFLDGLWYQFNLVPHLFSEMQSNDASGIKSLVFWSAAVIEWFIWGIILSFVFTGFRIRRDAKSTRSQHLLEIVLLMPCILPFILLCCREVQLRFGIEAEIFRLVGLVVSYASPLLVIYAVAILIFLAHRKNSLWIKTIEIVIVFCSVNLLIMMAAFIIGGLLGFEMMPVPS